MNEFFPKSNGNHSDQTQEINPVVNNNLENKGEKNRTIEGNNDATTQKEKLSQTGRPYPSLDSRVAKNMIKKAETINFTVHPLYGLLFEDLEDAYNKTYNDGYLEPFLKELVCLIEQDNCDFEKIYLLKMNYYFNRIRDEINQGMKVTSTFISFLEFYEEWKNYSNSFKKTNEIMILNLPNYKELNTFQQKAITLFLQSIPNQDKIISINSQKSNNGDIGDKDREILRKLLNKKQHISLHGGYRHGCVADSAEGLYDIQQSEGIKFKLDIDYFGTTDALQHGEDVSKYFTNVLSNIDTNQLLTHEFIKQYLLKNYSLINELHNLTIHYLNNDNKKNKINTVEGRKKIYDLPFKNNTPEDIEKWFDENIKEMK